MQHTVHIKKFRRWGLITIFATIFLIWVGGWVRSTGSGMGCPDWPKCFDVWIPPTAEAQLPPNYLEHYTTLRKKKNERVAKMLSRMGMIDIAEKIKNDPSVAEHEPFNAYKTWTEYINRLLGVLVGLSIFITLLLSWRVRSVDKRVFWLSLVGFIGVAFEGWLGSIVVSTNLMPGIITAHMVVAMLILVTLITAVVIAYSREGDISGLLQVKPMSLIWGGVGVSLLILIQIITGTQVRENVDIIGKTLGEANRTEWIANLSDIYAYHRFFYYIIAAAIMYWVWQLRGGLFKIKIIRNLSIALLGVLIAEILFGIAMHRLGIPPILQPLHLLFATLLFSTAFTITALLYLRKPKFI
jgi:cytochrome c oxidase assembly protein subunit 15